MDAVELVAHNIELFQQNTMEGEPVTITQGNAMDLSNFEGDTYDITLLLGPMYHLFTREDQLKALSEAIRVTKKGGIIFTAYCMGDASVLSYGFVRGEIYNIIEKCKVNPETLILSQSRGTYLSCTERKILIGSVPSFLLRSFTLLPPMATPII